MVLIKLTAGKAGLPCQSVWVSPDPCWHWAFFFFLLFCANFISVRESLGGASVYFLDGWESWTSFHFLKLTSYDPVRNVWGLSAHLSAGDLVLVQIKYCLCEAGCSSCSQWDSVSVHFFCVEALHFYPLTGQLCFVVSYVASNLGKFIILSCRWVSDFLLIFYDFIFFSHLIHTECIWL